MKALLIPIFATISTIALGQTVCTTVPDFMDLTSPCVICNYGGCYQDLYPPYTAHCDAFQYTGIAPGRHTVINNQGYDPNTGNKLPFIPAGETKSVRIGNAGINAEIDGITYHFQVQPDSSLLQIKFAVVMQDPGHPHDDQPRIVIKILDDKDSLVETCAEYDVSAAADIPGFQTYTGMGTPVRWRPWTTIAIDLSAYIGQNIKVQFLNYDCLQGGHFGYTYYTAKCLPSKLNLTACASDEITLEAPPFCESYLWTNGETTQSATFVMPNNGALSASCLITSVTGCEFTLDAHISPTPPTENMTIYDTICEGDAYNKNYFNLPPQFRLGTHCHVNEFFDINTCSGTATAYLYLTVKQKYYPINDITCSGLDYVKYGFSHLNPSPGIIRDTQRFQRPNISGSVPACDSIVILNLTVSRTVLTHPAEITGNAQPCNGYTEMYAVPNAEEYINFTWDIPDDVIVRNTGNSAPNTATIVLQFTDRSVADTLKVYAANGCGGAWVKLFVEPKLSHYLSFVDSVCSGLPYQENGFDIPRQDSVGFKIFTQSYSTQSGCDSIRNLYLNIYPTPEIAIQTSTDVICTDDSVQLQVTSADYKPSETSRKVRIGDILCTNDSVVPKEDYSGNAAIGVIFWVSDDQTHGWAVGLEMMSAGSAIRWATSYIFVHGIQNFATAVAINSIDTAGYQNTKTIQATGNATLFPAAWAVDFDEGWYLPALTQARRLWGNMELIKSSLNKVGATLRTNSMSMWTSSPPSDAEQAIYVGVDGYIQGSHIHYTNSYVYQTRTFKINKK